MLPLCGTGRFARQLAFMFISFPFHFIVNPQAKRSLGSMIKLTTQESVLITVLCAHWLLPQRQQQHATLCPYGARSTRLRHKKSRCGQGATTAHLTDPRENPISHERRRPPVLGSLARMQGFNDLNTAGLRDPAPLRHHTTITEKSQTPFRAET